MEPTQLSLEIVFRVITLVNVKTTNTLPFAPMNVKKRETNSCIVVHPSSTHPLAANQRKRIRPSHPNGIR